MNRTLVTLSLMIALLLPASMFSQVKNVYGGTGNVRFKLNRAGSVALYDGDFTTQISRLSLVIGLDSAHVFDYEEDAWYLTKSTFLSSLGITDTVATALFDNSYQDPIPPPYARILGNVYATKKDSFVVADFKLTNTAATAAKLYVGIGCVPKPSEAYGGETIAYDATKKIAYFYRTGETPYIGVKLLGADPVSFHALDWDSYSPTDADADAAVDSTRWSMTAKTGFDAPVTAGVNGSFFNLNFEGATIDAGSSATYPVALLRSTSLAGLRKLADSADARYAQLQAASPVKNVFGGTDKVMFKLNRAGSLALYDKDYNTQLNRASLVIGQDSAHVFDYEEDAQYLMTSSALSVGGAADTVADALFDNSYLDPPAEPNVRGWAEVHAWKNDPFVLVDYTITNYGSTAKKLYIGMGGVPKPSETYGGETVAYDATKKMAYFFRTGETPYVGVKLIGADPISFHALDWDVYSPTSGDADAAVDSTRWSMTAKPGFDAPVTGGVNGSFFNLNFDSPTVDALSSVTYTVAYLYANSLPELRTVADAAVARYNLATSVEMVNPEIPDRFALRQNYPNPFNPSTVIACQLPIAGHVKLVVYDLLGREIAVLADGQFAPGEYSFRFDGTGHASGVYFCRLIAGSFVTTTKMVLQK
jgi:hypothetical protein